MAARLLPLSLLAILPSLSIVAQSDPTFDTFVGTVYKIPARTLNLKFTYTDAVLEYEKAGTIELDELQIPNQRDSIPFPGTNLNNGFGIVFTSTVHIPQSGMYGFTLTSDDGSALWVDDKMVVDNDKAHPVRARGGKCFFTKGAYPIKIWYYQAFPFWYALEFKSKFIGSEKEEGRCGFTSKQTITLTSKELFFNTGSANLDATGKATIQQLLTTLEPSTVQKITIVGHTDDKGSPATNLQLSTDRAATVAAILRQSLLKAAIELTVLGKGEQEPIASNETEEGRQKNRRVEIRIE